MTPEPFPWLQVHHRLLLTFPCQIPCQTPHPIARSNLITKRQFGTLKSCSANGCWGANAPTGLPGGCMSPVGSEGLGEGSHTAGTVLSCTIHMAGALEHP